MKRILLGLLLLISIGAFSQQQIFMIVKTATTPPPTDSYKYEAESYEAKDDNVFIVSVTDGYAAQGISDGRWVDMVVNVPSAGTYNFTFRYKALYVSAPVKIIDNVATVLQTVTLPMTGDVWTTSTSASVTLPAGEQTLRLQVDQAANGIDLDWFEIEGALPTSRLVRWNLNFGNEFQPNQDRWTRLNPSTTAVQTVNGFTATNVLNNLRVASTLDITNLTAFIGTGTAQMPATDGTGVFPNTVIERFWSFANGAQLKFTGLDPAKTYNFYILSNSVNWESNTVSYTISGVTSNQIVTASNWGNSATYPDPFTDPALAKIENVTPNAQGEVVMTCNLIAGTYGPINGIVIKPN